MRPSTRLRVLHIIPHLGIGGAELQLYRLITHTPESDAQHEVIYYADAQDQGARGLFESGQVTARRIARSRGGGLSFLSRLTDAVREARPDIVHCWLVSACLWGRLAARRAGVPRLALSFRSSEIEYAPIVRASRWLGEKGIFYLANTRAVAASMQRDLKVPADRITVIPNGVEWEALPPRSAVDTNGFHSVVTVGRLAVEKNYPMLLRVAARFDAGSRVRFSIVGHGELGAALKGQAARLALDDRLRFLGLRHDVPDLLRAADLFAFTSRVEGAPNALLEAMAAGLPIVSTRFAGVDEILTDGHDALLVDHDDDPGFEAAVRRLLADPSAARALGDRARRTVEERFSVPTMVDATLAFYHRILGTAG